MCRKAVKTNKKTKTNLHIHKFRHKHPLFLSFTFNIWIVRSSYLERPATICSQ